MKFNKKEGFKKESDCPLSADVCSVHRTTLDLVFKSLRGLVLVHSIISSLDTVQYA